MISVDGAQITSNKRGLAALLRTLQAGDDASRRKLLENFEKHGLVGTVTDFGQLLLLFDHSHHDFYQFSGGTEQSLGGTLHRVHLRSTQGTRRTHNSGKQGTRSGPGLR